MTNHTQHYMDINKREMSAGTRKALDIATAVALGLSFAVLLVWQLSK